jgi:hypothetical protein
MNQILKNRQQQMRDETTDKVKSAIEFIKLNEGENAIISANKYSYTLMCQGVYYTSLIS